MWARTQGVGRIVGVLLGVALVVVTVPPVVSEAVAAEPGSSQTVAEQPTDDDVGTLTEAEAMTKAKKTGESVEIVSLRAESSEVYATPEGDLQAREYLRPVWTRTQGGWVRVDTNLAVTGDGMVAPKAATLDVEFSAGGEAPLVRMRRAGRELSLTWPTPLPKPELAGTVATYSSVLPDVDLRMTAQEDGFTQLLVVKTAEAAASEELAKLHLGLDTKGVSVEETSIGGLEAIDRGANGAVFEAPKPMMWDSSPGESPAGAARSRTAAAEGSAAAGTEPGAGESGKLAPVDVEVPEGQKTLVLTPDANVLRGQDTTYPVYIDPQWYAPSASAWTMASKYWANSPQWKFNGDSDAGMGYCNWTYCNPHDTKRLMYRIPTSRFAGKSILSAEFVVGNTWSASCTNKAVDLYQTKAISSSTTWNDIYDTGFFVKKLGSESFAYGHSGCAAKDAEFNVKSALQAAANAKTSTLTFGLKAENESDAYGWKRFSDEAHLRVEYNRAPTQIKMSQLTMEYGGTCKKPASAAHVRTMGTLRANSVTDPDGDSVRVQFQAAWDSGDGKGLIARWSPALTSAKKSGSSFSITLPASVPTNRQVNWYARTYDGAQYSPWSYAGDEPTGCYFVYDTSVPKAPALSSGEYPASDPEDPDDPWFDGVGKYGEFSLKAAEPDVTKYWYGLNSDPSSKNTLTTVGGAAKTVQVLPAEPGLNFMTAQAFDAAGNGSEVRTYQFRVKAGQPERAAWQLDESVGATVAQGSSGARVAALRGGALSGVPGVKGSAVSFDGVDDYAVTDIPTVNTENGFSVSAWVKLSQVPDHAAIVAAQPGNHSPGFELYYSHSYDRWVFNQYASDSPGAPVVRAMAPQAGGVNADRWTHLVGVYSGSTKDLRLYVDGTLTGTTPYSTAWDARRGLQIGAGSYSGSPASFLPGQIDEIRIFDKPVSPTEVGHLFRHEGIGGGRTARTVFSLDETSGALEVTGRADTQPLSLAGDARLGATGVAGKALKLDGTGDYARTAAPHIDTQRPFTVSAWAKLDRVPAEGATVVAQLGQNRPGFELYYSKSYNRWGFTQYSGDVPGATQVRAVQPDGTSARVGEWVHLVGVHDATANTLTLYVNGVKSASVAQSAAWYAGGPVQAGALSIDGGSLIQYFPGTIDDIRMFDRPVAEDEVRQLFRQRPIVKARWKFDQPGGTSTPDDSGAGNHLTLGGGTQLGSGWVDGGLILDGVNDYASSTTAPVDTSTSFTVTAWAQAAAVPQSGVTLLSMPGTQQNAFAVRYLPSATPDTDSGRWRISVHDDDSAGANSIDVENGQFFSAADWTHLALVYDGFTKHLSLYINGELEQVACADDDSDGQADDTACTDRLSWTDNVLAFKSAQPLQLGRAKTGTSSWGGYWPGAVSDVWAFQGTLTGRQVRHLAVGMPGLPTDVPGGDA
ncbi:tRNA(Glu)-specific nuclease WapA precursor [Streptomyces sp. ADI97-07]|nr:tRNA(Glu)-specific nuclease WapA precursor [Streptomyces sp. ADI97-07]